MGRLKAGFHLGKLSSGQDRNGQESFLCEPLIPTKSSHDKGIGNFPVCSLPEEKLGTLRSTTANLDDGVLQTKEFFIQNKENK